MVGWLLALGAVVRWQSQWKVLRSVRQVPWDGVGRSRREGTNLTVWPTPGHANSLGSRRGSRGRARQEQQQEDRNEQRGQSGRRRHGDMPGAPHLPYLRAICVYRCRRRDLLLVARKHAGGFACVCSGGSGERDALGDRPRVAEGVRTIGLGGAAAVGGWLASSRSG